MSDIKKNIKFLPIGSVVLLKDASQNVMIIGYKITSEVNGKNKTFDYLGCPANIGIKSKGDYLGFNREQIKKIISFGYMDDEWIQFEKVIENN